MKINEKNEIRIITDLLITLCTLSVITVYYYGSRALMIIIISVVTCVALDILLYKLRKIPVNKTSFLSASVTGLITALMMSAAVPYYLVFTASVFSIIIGRHAFGGHGYEIFNSSAAGFLFVSLSFGNSMLLYPKPFDELPLHNSIPVESLYQSLDKQLINASVPSADYMDILIGKFCGPMGTAYIILLAVITAVLIFRRSVSAISFLTVISAVTIYAYFYYGYNILQVMNFLGGGMLIFGLIFLACDYRTIPKSKLSRFIFGIILAVLIIIFEFYAKAENAVIYAVIIAAPICIELDKRAFSFADIVNFENSGLIVKIRRKFNKPAKNLNETLKILERGEKSENSGGSKK